MPRCWKQKILIEYDQEIPQSQTADKLHREEEPFNTHKTPGRQTKQSNQLSLQAYGGGKLESTPPP